mmetsp:Transcript_33525/g.74175  ORF Transcript_33525/g.74175 Transcript_33525/m.74175 type:complete len:287 (-) Transcript_33525:1218-2078(-)
MSSAPLWPCSTKSRKGWLCGNHSSHLHRTRRAACQFPELPRSRPLHNRLSQAVLHKPHQHLRHTCPSRHQRRCRHPPLLCRLPSQSPCQHRHQHQHSGPPQCLLLRLLPCQHQRQHQQYAQPTLPLPPCLLLLLLLFPPGKRHVPPPPPCLPCPLCPTSLCISPGPHHHHLNSTGRQRPQPHLLPRSAHPRPGHWSPSRSPPLQPRCRRAPPCPAPPASLSGPGFTPPIPRTTTGRRYMPCRTAHRSTACLEGTATQVGWCPPRGRYSTCGSAAREAAAALAACPP